MTPMRSSSTDDEEERTAFIEPTRVYRDQKQGPWRGLSRPFILLSVFNAVALGLTVTLLASWRFGPKTPPASPNDVYRQVNGASPLYDEVPLSPYKTTTNGTFWPANRPDGGSVARKMPNPTDEAVWDDWELTTVVPITASGIRELGKDPSTAAKLEDDVWGLGDDAYAGVLDVFHQIHCLNQLRKFAYADYYHMKIANADPEALTTHEVHTNHCVDILLQAIQCSGNLREWPRRLTRRAQSPRVARHRSDRLLTVYLEMVTMHWMERQQYPFPDMSTNRQCVEFDRIVEWRNDNRIDMKKFVATMKKDQQPGPVQERPAEQGYLDMFGG